jgi:predicted porin
MDKKLLAAAISSALVAPMAAHAIDFKTSGHINRMIRFADDGAGSDVQFTDNTASRSRVRFVGSGDIGNGMKAGVNLEIGFASNRSGTGGSNPKAPKARKALKALETVAEALEAVNALRAPKAPKGPDGGDSMGDIRHSALWYSGNWGKVTLGHTSSAADGITGSDLTGTWMADANTSYGACSGCAVRTAGGGTAATTLAGFHGTFDGGRMDILRYDTPALGPARIAVNVANNERAEVAAYVNADVGGGSLALAGGYIAAENRNGGDIFGISGSFRFSQGTAITLVYDQFDPAGAGKTADNFFAKLGHRWGANRVSISYGKTDDRATAGAGSEATRWGVGWQHEMPKPRITIYAAYHNYDQQITGTSFEDFDIFKIGTRVQFK